MKMLRVTLFVLLLLWGQDFVVSIRIVELRVPTHEREGGVALLGCQYDMEGELLYSLKWYKDDVEFFRYAPSSEPNIMYFRNSGVTVDLARSSSTVVALVNLTQQSSGRYRCEVSGEAPSFQVTSKEKEVSIQFLPQGGPRLTGGRYEYNINDLVVMNCTSPPSRPKAHLKWLVNDVAVSRERVYGPWERKAKDILDAYEVTLQLRFFPQASDFVKGIMKVTCQSTIAPMYQHEISSIHELASPYTAETRTDESVTTNASDDILSTLNILIFWMLII